MWVSFFFQAEDSIRDYKVTGVQTCALPILSARAGMLTKFSRPPGAICIVIFPVPDVLRLIDATSKVGPAPWGTEIGRASCRERVSGSGGAVRIVENKSIEWR